MEVLVNELLKLGARRERLEAKLFGGARMMGGLTDVGAQNAAFAQRFLRDERIGIAAQDLLDIYPRKVYYFPHTGRALMRKLPSMHNDSILRPEREYGNRLRNNEVEGDVELFT